MFGCARGSSSHRKSTNRTHQRACGRLWRCGGTFRISATRHLYNLIGCCILQLNRSDRIGSSSSNFGSSHSTSCHTESSTSNSERRTGSHDLKIILCANFIDLEIRSTRFHLRNGAIHIAIAFFDKFRSWHGEIRIAVNQNRGVFKFQSHSRSQSSSNFSTRRKQVVDRGFLCIFPCDVCAGSPFHLPNGVNHFRLQWR